jgi:hypothetical protein
VSAWVGYYWEINYTFTHMCFKVLHKNSFIFDCANSNTISALIWDGPVHTDLQIQDFPFKADSQIAYRTHAVPLPCHAAKGLECVFPIWFTQCGRVWFTLSMLRPCHPRPCRSSQGHSTAWPSREGLWANCPRSASSGYRTEFNEAVIRRIPISDAGGQRETKHRLSWTRKRVVAAHYKKDDLFHCWTSSSDISSYHVDFHEGHGTVGAGQGRGMACVN